MMFIKMCIRDSYEAMVDIFRKHEIKYVLLNGGNGTMDTCGKIYEVCKDAGIYVVGKMCIRDSTVSIQNLPLKKQGKINKRFPKICLKTTRQTFA